MKPIHAAINAAVNAMLAGKEEVGPDDRAGAAQILVEMIAGSRPGLAQRLEAFYERPDVVNAVVERDDWDKADPALASKMFEILSPYPKVNPCAPDLAAIRENLVAAGR